MECLVKDNIALKEKIKQLEHDKSVLLAERTKMKKNLEHAKSIIIGQRKMLPTKDSVTTAANSVSSPTATDPFISMSSTGMSLSKLLETSLIRTSPKLIGEFIGKTFNGSSPSLRGSPSSLKGFIMSSSSPALRANSPSFKSKSTPATNGSSSRTPFEIVVL
eukprot:gene10718-12467_t